MKKQILLVALSALGFATLAGCGGTSTSSNATPMQKEIVSAALLQDPTAKASYTKALKNQQAATKHSPIAFDANDVSASLASFDALSLNSFAIVSEEKTSDKAEYTHLETITYTLPDASTTSLSLYFNDPVSKSWSISASVNEEGNDTEIEAKLHGQGFRSGNFNGLLKSDMKIDDYEDEIASIDGSWKEGLALINETEYRFYSEQLHVVVTEDDGEVETSDLSAFALYNASSFTAVEQFGVIEGTEVETAYAYTSFSKGSYELFLLSDDSDDKETRLVYLSNGEKLVIVRFEKDGKTLYAIRVKQIAGFKFIGIYEKVESTDVSGNVTTSYRLVSEDATAAPSED